jgi:hypothetical protein
LHEGWSGCKRSRTWLFDSDKRQIDSKRRTVWTDQQLI